MYCITQRPLGDNTPKLWQLQGSANGQQPVLGWLLFEGNLVLKFGCFGNHPNKRQKSGFYGKGLHGFLGSIVSATSLAAAKTCAVDPKMHKADTLSSIGFCKD